jgi:hypothetical protein
VKWWRIPGLPLLAMAAVGLVLVMVFPLPTPITARIDLPPPGSNLHPWTMTIDARTGLLWLGMILTVLVVGSAVWLIGRRRRRAVEKPQDEG